MRRLIRPVLSLATTFLLVLPGLVRAAEPPCLTPSEFTSLATYALPDIMAGTMQRCMPVLPADAFLKTGGPALANRYAQAKPAAWPDAKAALLKMGSGAQGDAADLLKSLPDASQQQLVSTLVQGVVAEKVPTERCGTIDHMLQLLSPLPPESTAEIIGMAVGLGSRTGQARLGKFQICAS